MTWALTLFVPDRSLDVLTDNRKLNLKGGGILVQGLDEDLHATAYQVLLDVVVSQGVRVLQLLASEDQALLRNRSTWVSRNGERDMGSQTHLFLDFGLDSLHGVR